MHQLTVSRHLAALLAAALCALCSAAVAATTAPTAAAAPAGPAAPGAARDLTLLLDWVPNPDHVGIYWAKQNGMFARRGLNVKLQAPSDPSAPIRLVGVGKADLAVSYEPELFFAAAKKLPVIAVASGEAKLPAIRAALAGHLVNGLITSEATAERLLAG